MLDNQLAKLKEWFGVYTTKYHSSSKEITAAIDLKIHHTALVCDNVKEILKELNWPSSDTFTAEAAALLHDIGRLPQINNFGTFNDYKSIDHGILGVQVLLEENALKCLSGQDQRVVLTAVRWHNKYAEPDDLGEDERKVLKLVRDADKLDIMRLFTEYYPTADEHPLPFVEFGLKKNGECSEKIAADIMLNRIANIKNIENITDLRIAKLSWLYDLNYETSRRLFRERRYIEKTVEYLPETPRIRQVVRHLQEHFKTAV